MNVLRWFGGGREEPEGETSSGDMSDDDKMPAQDLPKPSAKNGKIVSERSSANQPRRRYHPYAPPARRSRLHRPRTDELSDDRPETLISYQSHMSEYSTSDSGTPARSTDVEVDNFSQRDEPLTHHQRQPFQPDKEIDVHKCSCCGFRDAEWSSSKPRCTMCYFPNFDYHKHCHPRQLVNGVNTGRYNVRRFLVLEQPNQHQRQQSGNFLDVDNYTRHRLNAENLDQLNGIPEASLNNDSRTGPVYSTIHKRNAALLWKRLASEEPCMTENEDAELFKTHDEEDDGQIQYHLVLESLLSFISEFRDLDSEEKSAMKESLDVSKLLPASEVGFLYPEEKSMYEKVLFALLGPSAA